MTGISPLYIELSHRFVSQVGPKSLAALSHDTGIPVASLEKYADDKTALTNEDVMKIYVQLFGNSSFVEAANTLATAGL